MVLYSFGRKKTMRKLKYLVACALMSSLVLACNEDEDPKDKEDEEQQSYCGDDVCDADETHASCPEDCEEEEGEDGPVCGDGVCDEDETDESCPEDCRDTGGIADTASVCVATYKLSAQMDIEGTPGKLGDSVEQVDGELGLRYVRADDGSTSPADGEGVEILQFFIENKMLGGSDTLELVIDTAVYGFTPDCNGETDIDKMNLPDACEFDADEHTVAKAVGVYDADTKEITWDRCVKPEEFYVDPANGGYTPEHEANGPGCLEDYHSQGNVHCDGDDFCVAGQLENGDNIQDNKWNQPLETFSMSTDGSSLSVERIRVPNAQPSSTYLSFDGERIAITCEDLDHQ